MKATSRTTDSGVEIIKLEGKDVFPAAPLPCMSGSPGLARQPAEDPLGTLRRLGQSDVRQSDRESGKDHGQEDCEQTDIRSPVGGRDRFLHTLSFDGGELKCECTTRQIRRSSRVKCAEYLPSTHRRVARMAGRQGFEPRVLRKSLAKRGANRGWEDWT